MIRIERQERAEKFGIDHQQVTIYLREERRSRWKSVIEDGGRRFECKEGGTVREEGPGIEEFTHFDHLLPRKLQRYSGVISILLSLTSKLSES